MSRAWPMPYPRGLVAAGFAALALAGTLASQALGQALSADPASAQAPALLEAVPRQFGSWHAIEGGAPPVNPAQPEADGQPGRVYDAIVSRTYAAADGSQVMLMLAWQRAQYQEDRIHSPELCYYAQGFVLNDRRDVTVPIGVLPVPARAFHGASLARREDVVYWIRTGNLLHAGSLDTRREIFTAALAGRIDDGLLVRVSTTDDFGPARSAEARRALLVRFLQDLFAASPAPTRAVLVGNGDS